MRLDGWVYGYICRGMVASINCLMDELSMPVMLECAVPSQLANLYSIYVPDNTLIVVFHIPSLLESSRLIGKRSISHGKGV